VLKVADIEHAGITKVVHLFAKELQS
jgi:hypothetical protein